MLEISIVKMFFFDLLRRKNFRNSLFFTKNSLSDISKEIEKKYAITIIDSIFNNSGENQLPIILLLISRDALSISNMQFPPLLIIT